jgi:hypothetical protein
VMVMRMDGSGLRKYRGNWRGAPVSVPPACTLQIRSRKAFSFLHTLTLQVYMLDAMVERCCVTVCQVS